MSFQDLSKEQKQMAALAVMSVIVVIALGNQLVLGPAKEKAASAQRVIEEKANERTLGERMLKRDPTVRQELGEMAAALLQEQQEGRLPPVTGKEFWAQKRLTALGFNLGLNLTVSEHNTLRHILFAPDDDKIKPEDISFWVPYAVEVSVRAGYADVMALIDKVHETDPYASLASLSLSASKTDPLRHDVLLIYEWPTPRFQEDLSLLAGYQEGTP
jgi:hypothetical protein